MQIRILAAVLVALLTLSACGQSGALYLPEENPAEQQNQ